MMGRECKHDLKRYVRVLSYYVNPENASLVRASSNAVSPLNRIGLLGQYNSACVNRCLPIPRAAVNFQINSKLLDNDLN